jgi:hypothetical protein
MKACFLELFQHPQIQKRKNRFFAYGLPMLFPPFYGDSGTSMIFTGYQSSCAFIFHSLRSRARFDTYNRYLNIIDCFETNVTFSLADIVTTNSSLQETSLEKAHLVALRRDAFK